MKKFLASVGRGILVGRQNDIEQVIANVDTLTESTLSITSTQEEVRAGQGAKLYGRFNHDAGLTVTLTDAMFDLNYIALQVGAELQRGGIAMHTEEVVATSEDWSGTALPTLRVSKPIQQMGESCGFDKYVVWFRKAGCDAADTYTTAAYIGDLTAQATYTDGAFIVMKGGQVIQAPANGAIEIGERYCVSYFTDELSAKTVLVNANFVPAELSLVLTTKLFAGDASNPETGKPVGEITIKIPRFSLDGAFDLSMAMSSAATMSLNGTALATASSDCEGDGVYAEIVEVLNGQKWYTGIQELVPDLDLDGFEEGDKKDEYNMLISSITPNATVVDIYALFADKTPQRVPNYYLALQESSTFKSFDKYTGAFTGTPTDGQLAVIGLNTELAENDGATVAPITINFVDELPSEGE